LAERARCRGIGQLIAPVKPGVTLPFTHGGCHHLP